MRDPARIERICDKLKTIWTTVPDWRIGQLISNFFLQGGQDLFYIEDTNFEAELDRIIAKISKNHEKSLKNTE